MTSSVISVLIVDDHPVVHDGVVAQLRSYPDIVVVGHAADAAKAVSACKRCGPDIVLLDVRLPDALAADVVPRLRSVSPASRILLFSAFPQHAAVAPALEAGACGLLVKEASGTALRDALREVAGTGGYSGLTPGSHAPPSAPVTRREYDVLRLVAAGHTNLEIGKQLNLSPHTVKTYLRNVMRKLDARNRTQVITRARTHGLL
ncbi:response regulator transcription factor [Streptomyces phaeochromogenes]|uniref:response regulator transcription factor n=1 Tax=Streptomyces phaeochromogenes TaxID=1923 RepID=UPI0033E30A9A